MPHRTARPLSFVLLLSSACSSGPSHAAGGELAASPAEVVAAAEVEWEWLNPARGDKSPAAGTLWGDRRGTGPTGFLLRPVDGFESPPHIHNVTYRGVVIRGLIHNDDPDAGEMWMPAGSFWTQPKGQVHITAAKGDTLAYIEIDRGPYLVLPTARSFDDGERPINVHASNVVWVTQPDTSNVEPRPRRAYLWGDPQDDAPSGTLVELPAGFAGTLRGHGASLHAVVIAGQPRLRVGDEAAARTLDPGSAFRSTGPCVHPVASGPESRSVLYVRAEGRFDVVPVPAR